jgi:hypothetical protein
MLRTRLLHSLAKGRPHHLPSSMASSSARTLVKASLLTYAAETVTVVNHLHAVFGDGLNKGVRRLIHGADECGVATRSDPNSGKLSTWGRNDPNGWLAQFADGFPGVAPWGLGAGEIVGRPNVMDVSQPYGMVYGSGCPQGFCYFRPYGDQTGKYIAQPTALSMPEIGMPYLDGGAVCSVWIAKSDTIPSLSEGLVGILLGSAAGVVSACSLGTDGLRGARVPRGELTARWVLSPGVPIISIAVDEHHSLKRQAQNRIWAVALNALGELFYLTKFPTRSTIEQDTLDYGTYIEHRAWLTGRSVYWNLVEPSRRTARPDPYGDLRNFGSYSPRTSWDGMCLSKEQVFAETREIQKFLLKWPREFQDACLGWDMRRRLEADFAGDDGNYAGEAMVVFECGLEEDDVTKATRYTRWRTHESDERLSVPTPTAQQIAPTPSLFGGSTLNGSEPSDQNASQRARSSSYASIESSPERGPLCEEWRCSDFTFGGFKLIKITATAVDCSTYATVTMSEDPALGFSTASTASSPYASPESAASQPTSPSDIPGQRARFVAAGTNTGMVLLWDMRASVSPSARFANTIDPIRIILTESPEISCVALTALQVVVGGVDGLVEAWDPLASETSATRVLHSRHASRARRRLLQAQASVQGVGINMYAAGAIVLDPDPTVLRGAVSLGNQIRYWSYSSLAADQHKSSKRKLRRSERGNNIANERYAGISRLGQKNYIANEQHEAEQDKLERLRQAKRLEARFGVGLVGSEEEALAYATMLSQETTQADESRRKDGESDTVTPESSVHAQSSLPTTPTDPNIDADLAEAIRRSLHIDANPIAKITIAKGKKGWKKSKSPSPKSSPSRADQTTAGASSSSGPQQELSDLEFAMQLSLAEEESRKAAEGGDDEFPPLSPSPKGKGKGKAQAKWLDKW